MFQFTHPGKGATRQGSFLPPCELVSIHTPWEGCDWTLVYVRGSPPTFQFTHPGKGATTGEETTLAEVVAFQFTHPGKGATERDQRIYADYKFQFTHPGKGATSDDMRFPK